MNAISKITLKLNSDATPEQALGVIAQVLDPRAFTQDPKDDEGKEGQITIGVANQFTSSEGIIGTTARAIIALAREGMLNTNEGFFARTEIKP